MGFCTVADVAAFLQVAIAADDVSCLRAIDEATAAIQEHCEQAIESVEDDVATFDVEWGRTKLLLPELPVSAVTSVVEDGVELTEGTDYKLGASGILHRVGRYWSPGVQAVAVTYDHGHSTVPEIVKDVCTRAAARAYQAGVRAAAVKGLAGVQGQTLGAYSVTLAAEASPQDGTNLGASAAPILLPSERGYLSRWKKERI